MVDPQNLSVDGPKQTKEGTRYCTVTNTETNVQYQFILKNDSVACPSVVGATDTEGLTAACEKLESSGYTVDTSASKTTPAGFQYPR